MPVYVPNYKHDIFVSYAHVDNAPFAGAEKGWVTTLIGELKNQLGRKLGRSEAYSLWMDYELRGNEPLTPDINEQLSNCATFLLIFSRGYLQSRWCRLEMNTFLALSGGSSSGRIFMIEPDFISPEEKPSEFQDLLGYPFWIKNSDTGRTNTLGIPKPNPSQQPEYYQKLNELASDLTSKLNQLRDEILATQPQEESNLSLIAERKQSRLISERTGIETEIAKKAQEHEFTSSSLSMPNLPKNTRRILDDKLHQLETDIEKLETERAKIDLELKQLGG